MQQNIAQNVQAYLPEINASELNLDEGKYTQAYADGLKQFSEKINSWSHAVLEKAKLPTAPHEAKALTTKYKLDCNEGCALHMVIELDSMKKSIAQNDATTAALASMKLANAVWHSSIFRNPDEHINIVENKTNTSNASSIQPTKSQIGTNTHNDEKLALYQKTINELQGKYPNCNINALRLLAATRLNTSKQELDDLDISPE